MAAPESTITSMHTAVAGPGAAPSVAAAAPRRSAPPVRIVDPVGDESRELSRLRAGKDPGGREGRDGRENRAESCDLDRPTHSRAPRYESRRDVMSDDVDDLDSAGTEALSRLQLPDLKIPITRRTLKYVKFFTRTDKGRGLFESWLKRSGRYQEMVQGELRERRLPEDLIWVAMIESGFDPRAQSPAGAVGLWQFMAATGEVYGLAHTHQLDQRKNPRLATQAAAHHLRDLYLRFGEWDLALAAYNMGYEQLLDTIDRYGTTDFNELARQEAVPAETAAYVPKIAAAAIVANNLERFGFDRVELQRPIDAAEIPVPPGTPLKTLAKAAGVSTSTVRGLNPDILGERVPPGRGDYMLLIPADTLGRAQASLPPLLDTEAIVTDEQSILDPVNLMAARKRHLRDEDQSLLTLLPHPKHRRAMRDAFGGEEEEEGDDRGVDADEPRLGSRRGHRSGRETMMYKVGDGDTMVGVARQFAMDVEDVAHDNHLDVDAKLRVGSLIRLRVRKDQMNAPKGGADEHDKDAAPKRDEGRSKSSDRDDSPGEKAATGAREGRGASRPAKHARPHG